MLLRSAAGGGVALPFPPRVTFNGAVMFKPPVIAAIGGEVPVPMATTPVPVAIAVAPS